MEGQTRIAQKEIIRQHLLNGGKTATPRLCIIEGCEREHCGRGWCKHHYNNWYHRGDPLSVGILGAASITHGRTFTVEYSAWRSMKLRCYLTSRKDYSRYGGRGIRVCRQWLNSFENFLADMGEKPTPRHQLDRINNDKGYSPDNCRWATPKEQANNRSRNRLIEFNRRANDAFGVG